MTVVLILTGLAVTCLFMFGWFSLLAGFRRGGRLGAFGIAAVQISGLCLAYGTVRGQPMGGLFMAAFPPLALVKLAEAARFWPFLSQLALAVAPYGAIALLAALAAPRLRVWSPGLALLAALVAAVFVGDHVSKDAMCKAAARRGFATFARNSFSWSLADSGQAPVLDLHALRHLNNDRWGWSYRDLDWYAISPETLPVRGGEEFTCPAS